MQQQKKKQQINKYEIMLDNPPGLARFSPFPCSGQIKNLRSREIFGFPPGLARII